MTISHRAATASEATFEATTPTKVARIACCCKLADLLPIVQKLHREAARANAAQAPQRSEAA